VPSPPRNEADRAEEEQRHDGLGAERSGCLVTLHPVGCLILLFILALLCLGLYLLASMAKSAS
jgi:hypothetical protein